MSGNTSDTSDHEEKEIQVELVGSSGQVTNIPLSYFNETGEINRLHKAVRVEGTLIVVDDVSAKLDKDKVDQFNHAMFTTIDEAIDKLHQGGHESGTLHESACFLSVHPAIYEVPDKVQQCISNIREATRGTDECVDIEQVFRDVFIQIGDDTVWRIRNAVLLELKWGVM